MATKSIQDLKRTHRVKGHLNAIIRRKQFPKFKKNGTSKRNFLKMEKTDRDLLKGLLTSILVNLIKVLNLTIIKNLKRCQVKIESKDRTR